MGVDPVMLVTPLPMAMVSQHRARRGFVPHGPLRSLLPLYHSPQPI